MKQIDFFLYLFMRITYSCVLHKIDTEFGNKVPPSLLCIDYCFFLRLLVE